MPIGELDQRDAWIVTASIPEAAERIKRIRAADENDAIRLLELFAYHRPVESLLTLEPNRGTPGHFNRHDASAILALAALTRRVEDAADLLLGQWEKEEGADSPLTDRIIHDVTAQRTVSEVADLVRICHRKSRNSGGCVGKLLEAFTEPRSGRTNFDKALLFVDLKNGAHTGDVADVLLDRALEKSVLGTHSEKKRNDGIIAVLHHLSPSDVYLHAWVEARIPSMDQGPAPQARPRKPYEESLKLVADLLADDPHGSRPLARYIGAHWNAGQIRDLCQKVSKSPDCYHAVLEYAAINSDTDKLSNLFGNWRSALPHDLPELLTAITRTQPGEASGPRSIAALAELERAIVRPPETIPQLWIAAAGQIGGRPGADIADLLTRVQGTRNLIQAADAINEQFADRLFAADHERFSRYLRSDGFLSSVIRFWGISGLLSSTLMDLLTTIEETAETPDTFGPRTVTFLTELHSILTSDETLGERIAELRALIGDFVAGHTQADVLRVLEHLETHNITSRMGLRFYDILEPRLRTRGIKSLPDYVVSDDFLDSFTGFRDISPLLSATLLEVLDRAITAATSSNDRHDNIGRRTQNILTEIHHFLLASSSVHDLADTHTGPVADDPRATLRGAIEDYFRGRTADDAARILGQIERHHILPRLARHLYSTLAARLRERDIGAFVDYVRALQTHKSAGQLTFWALRTLSDPDPRHEVSGAPEPPEIAGAIAARLYRQPPAEGRPGRSMQQVASELLERCLENEQAFPGPAAVEIVSRTLQGSPRPEGEAWLSLLKSTVGRWASMQSREAVARGLGDAGYEPERDAILQAAS